MSRGLTAATSETSIARTPAASRSNHFEILHPGISLAQRQTHGMGAHALEEFGVLPLTGFQFLHRDDKVIVRRHAAEVVAAVLARTGCSYVSSRDPPARRVLREHN